MPLDDPHVAETALRSCGPDAAVPIADLLREASKCPWAAEVSVVTSLGHLSLTAQRAFNDATPSGAIHISLAKDGDFVFAYQPPHSDECVARITRRRHEALAALHLMVTRLLEEHGKPGVEARSSDCDPDRPRYELGARVRVILNERNRTRHDGVVARHIWHYKWSCWTYFLVEAGNKIKKRYVAEDLEPVRGGGFGRRE
jgi:hypothetical protein